VNELRNAEIESILFEMQISIEVTLGVIFNELIKLKSNENFKKKQIPQKSAN
jgi:hypothetical protein